MIFYRVCEEISVFSFPYLKIVVSRLSLVSICDNMASCRNHLKHMFQNLANEVMNQAVQSCVKYILGKFRESLSTCSAAHPKNALWRNV